MRMKLLARHEETSAREERMEMEKLSHCHGVTAYSEGGRAEYRYVSIREGERNKIENKRSRKVSKEERAHGRKIGHREPTHPSFSQRSKSAS